MQRAIALLLRRGVPLLAATTLGMLASSGVANAASFTVTTTNDSNDNACTASLCSLRDAVVAADAAGGSSTITVPAGTYTLTIPSATTNDPTTGDLDIDNSASVTITGAGSGSTIIDANQTDRAFAVQDGASLSLSRMTIENGQPATSSTGYPFGGAIYVAGSSGALTVANSVLSDNSAAIGGAIWDEGSTGTTLDGDRFTNNSAANAIGGVGLVSSTSTGDTVNGDEFDDNSGGSSIGALLIASSGPFSSSGSSFIGNSGGGIGGGIYVSGPPSFSLVNATISRNSAATGGGIYFDSSTPTTMTNDTIALNRSGGGVYDTADISTGSGSTGVLNTIIAGNAGGDCDAVVPSASDAGHNLDGDKSCFQGDASSDKLGVDPKLGPPADNGGSVLTDALLTGSPAIDAGANTGCPSTDARGVPRPQGSACDIGAFEAAASALTASNSAPSSGVTDIPFTYTITVKPTGPGPSTGTTVTDQLPAGETLYGATPSQGTCNSTGSPAKVSCDLGTVAVGNNATVTLLVAEANAGSVTDTATATNDQGQNVSASATTKLTAPVAPAGATAPKATTYGHSNKTKHSAVVHGHISTGGQPTWYFFQYGRSRFFGQVTRLVRVTSSKNVAATIRHLRAGKKYFFRLVAVNDSGIRYGAMHSFRTKHNRRHHRHHHRLHGGY